MTEGVKNVDVNYPGDIRYNPAFASKNITVSKINVSVGIVADDIFCGDDLVVGVSFDANVSGSVVVSVDGVGKTVAVVDGRASVVFSDLTEGVKKVDVNYPGDKRYNPAFVSKNITASKINTAIFILADDVNYGDLLEVKINLTNVTDGKVNISIGDISKILNVSKGVAKTTFENLDAGIKTIYVSYLGDYRYNPSSNSKTIHVNKIKPDLSAEVSNILFGNDEIINITLPEKVSGSVIVNIDNKNYSLLLKNGFGTLTISNLTTGRYVVKIDYNGDNNYLANSLSEVFSVAEKTADFNASCKDISFGENAKVLVVDLPADATGNVSLSINGKTYFAVVNRGNAIIEIPDLSSGSYDVNVTYNGDLIYLPVSKSVEFSVKQVYPSMNISSEVLKNGSVMINVELPKEATGSVLINVNDIFFNVNVTDGIAKLGINNLQAGEYNVTAVYAGNNNYITASAIDSFIVSKKSIGTVIVVNSSFSRVATDYGAGERGGVFNAILLDEFGNPLANKTVYIVINGPIYNVTTDSEGHAGLVVNLAYENIYTYALFFAGDKVYRASHLASSKLLITKKATTIAASSKTFKDSSKQTVTATLKTSKNPYDGKTYLNKGKKLTLKVDGKRYSGKINSGGIVKFNIKLTKKGKYTAKITFDGDRTYDGSVRSIKITIK